MTRTESKDFEILLVPGRGQPTRALKISRLQRRMWLAAGAIATCAFAALGYIGAARILGGGG